MKILLINSLSLHGKDEKMVKKFIYVVGWSMALFVATFPNLIMGKMNLNFSAMEFSEVRDTYMFPIVMAMALFVGDAAYIFIQEKCEGKEQKHIVLVIVMICIYLFSFIFSLYGNEKYGYIGLICAWVSLTIMKFLKTEKCKQTDKIPEAKLITEES